MMQDEDDPLKQFSLEAIDLRWTLKDIAAKRFTIAPVDSLHLQRLIDLRLVEVRDSELCLTSLGQREVWRE
jgi:hypothetical protein